jgi:nitroimidazol reductase NimA-like FMN-containing flavoprotein (pyridoxamine 5'-phosphate oxidase superfamily)
MPQTPPPLRQTRRNTPARHSDRADYDRAVAYEVIDEAWHCHLSYVSVSVDDEVEPRILPTLHVRVDDTLYLHGSTASTPLLRARGPRGLPVCVAVTHIDGLVLARSQFNHSANYRSVIVHGLARLVTDEPEKRRILTAFVEKVGPGRAADSRPPTRKELAMTAVLAVPLDEVSIKIRTGSANDDPRDLDLPHWAGVVGLEVRRRVPEPAPGVTADLPAYLADRSDQPAPSAEHG